MKTMIKVTAMVLGMLIPFSSHSDSIEVVGTNVTGSKTFRLTLQDNAKNIQLRLVDQSGFTLYEEAIDGPVSYERVFNVSSLPTGNYKLELEYPTKHQILPVEIRTTSVVLDQSQMVEYFKPIVSQKGTTVSINMLNTKRGPLKILVYDTENNDLLSQSNLRGAVTLGKQFDFSQAKPGNYLISMTCNGQRYSQTITIDE